MRLAILLFAVTLAVSSAIQVSRPAAPLNLKLNEARRQLGASVRDKSFVETMEHLSVAAAERETSLADKFAVDLAAHVAAKEEAEAVAGMEEAASDANADAGESNEGDTITSELAIESAGESEGELSFESLQSLEFFESHERRGANAKPKTLKTGPTKPVHVSRSGNNIIKKDKAQYWSNCQSIEMSVAAKVGMTTFSNIALRANPPVRTASFAIEIDGTYTGPDISYGSVTLQIARVKTDEITLNKQTKRTEKPPVNVPHLVYRHSIVLSDVVNDIPLKSGQHLSTTLYIPTEAFDMYAAAGEYKMTAVFTNQNKLPFACALVDFRLA